MAEATGVADESVQIQAQASVVAAPKFVFGQSMSDRVKDPDSSESDNSNDKEDKKSDAENSEEIRVSKKRPAEDDVNEEDTTKTDSQSNPDGPLSPVKKVARVFNWAGAEEEDVPKQFILKPSILNEVAKTLTGTSTSATEESGNTASSLPKTFGLSSTSESTSTEKRTGASAPEPVAEQTKNYFQMFLDKNNDSLEKQKAGTFVFGCNMSDRVTFANQSEDDKSESGADPDQQKPEETSTSEDTPQVIDGQKQPKTLQEVAKSCANKDGPNSPTTSLDKHQLSLAEAAKMYEDSAGPSKSKYEQVEKVTGEEEERNVLKINCRLFMFDVDDHNWREKGRGHLRLNDMCKAMSDTTFQSRLVMRTQGHLRVTLNTKLWPEMTIERANEKSLRITGLEAENNVKIYLIMAGPKDVQQLYTAIDRRIQALKRNKEEQETAEANPKSDSAEGSEETNDSKKDAKRNDSEPTSAVNRRAIGQDESSNESYPIRSKDSFSDDE